MLKKSWELQQKLISNQIDRFVLEFKMKHKDGHWVDILSRAEAIFNDSGKAIRIVGTHTDITERKRAEEMLRETNEYLENLFNYANAPIIVWDNEFKITRFNAAFENLSGYEADEVIGKKVDVLFPKEKVESSLELISKTAFGARWESVEIEILRKHGEIRIVLWNSANIFDASGNEIVTTIAHGHDISERKLAEKLLQESETKFRAMVEVMPLAMILTTGVEQFIQYMNPKMIELFGYTIDDILTVDLWWPLAYPDENYRQQIADEWTRKVKHAIETQSPIEKMETEVTCKDGSKKHILWDYITMGDKSYTCGLDLTERIKAEEEIQNQLVELRRWYDVTLDREGRVLQLKQEVNELLKQSGEPLRYGSAIPDDQDAKIIS
jgi:PAS domain S-box-containing protein